MPEAEWTNIQVGCGLAKGDDSFAGGADAAGDAMAAISEHSPSVVLVFASVRYDLEELLKGVHSVIADAPVIGVTTAGEIYNGPQSESAVVTVLASPNLKVRVGVGEGVSGDWLKAISQAVGTPEVFPFFSLQDSTIWRELTCRGKAAFGLFFSPGNTRYADSRGYLILEELKRLSQGRLPIFGGAAADDWHMEANYVLYDKRAYPDSFLVAVFETGLEFGTAMAHGFHPGPEKSTVTRSRGQEVLELDGRPAAEVYARLLGSSREELEGKHLTLTSGRPAGSPDPYGQYSISTPSYFTPSGAMRLTQPLPEGTLLTVMEPRAESLVRAGREAMRKALLRGNISTPAIIFVFSCALRQKILGKRVNEEISGMTEMIPGVPIVGFYSFGEQGLSNDGVNRHNNGVITVLAIGRELSYAIRVGLENERLRDELKLRMADLRRSEKELKKAHADLEIRVHDRTAELAKANEALRESEERYRLVFENAPLGIMHFDRIGRITDCNDRFADIIGAPREKIIGFDLLLRLRDEKFRKAVVTALEGKTGHYEGDYLSVCGGRLRRLRALFQRIVSREAEFLGAVGIFEDTTERKKIEEELSRIRKLESIGIFAGGIAHDFNNLLGIILGHISLVQMDLNQSSNALKQLKEAEKVCLHSKDLTQQLIAFASEGGTPVKKAESIQEILRAALNLTPAGSNVRCEFRADEDLWPINCDSGQIRQALMKVIINAREAMREGELIEIEARNVQSTEGEIPSLRGGKYVKISVTDHGTGIPKDRIAKIFDPYFSTKERGTQKGMGLGLTIAHSIVKGHEGHISVESKVDGGTTFHIYLQNS